MRGVALPQDARSQDAEVPNAVDTNPDPHIVEVQLEAKVSRVTYAPGKQVEAWTYNGGIPGPLIRAHIGDRLIVHFTNNLPQPSTVHWRGIRLPIQMDGVPGVSQSEVRPGGSFTYDFVVPDAGLFWYHPHVMSAEQVGYGLYGALLVEDPAEPKIIGKQRVMVLSDIGIEDSGTLQSPEGAGAARMVFGLEGNHLLVNGQERPTFSVQPGTAERWRIVNTAKTRYFDLQADGVRFTIVGGDGGLQEYAGEPQEILVIAPGQRVDVIVKAVGDSGSEAIVRALPHNRGYGSEYVSVEDLFILAFTSNGAAESGQTDTMASSMRRSIPPLETAGATRIPIDITLVQLDPKNIEYRINDAPLSAMKPVQAHVGETQIWTITNQTQWSHPIHLHGFFFQVLDQNDQPVHPIAWRDTVDVPFNETVRFAVRYDDRPGAWMFHCHILDHADGGVMGMVDLASADASHAPHTFPHH